MINIKDIGLNIKLIKHLIRNTWIVVFLVEIILYHNFDTLIALLFSSLGLFICAISLFTERNLLYYPVSTIAVLMYPFFFMFLPPIATLIEFKPVIYNLHDPFNTYSQMLILLCALVIIHALYIKLSSKFILKKVLFKSGFFSRLTSQELWAAILISLLVYVYRIYTYGLYDENELNTRAELPFVVQLIIFIMGSAYSIVLIFYMRKFSVIKDQYKINNPLIVFVIITSFVTGVATNMRTASIICFSMGLFLFIVYELYYPLNLRKIFTVKHVVIYGLLVWFFTGPFLDISNAMLLSRSDRSGLNGFEVLQETMSNIDSDNTQKEDDYKSTEIDWDERYLSNHILNRFCSVKILDESLFHAKRAGYSNAKLRETLYNKIEDDMPGIVKRLFGIKNDPEIRHYSLTDRLYNLSVPSTYLGGVKIGTLQGLGMGLFGWWYLVILVPIYLILFYLMDSTVYFYKNSMRFSYWFLFNVDSLVYWFSDRHYYQWEIRWIFRTFWEGIFFFFIFMFIIKRLPFIKH